MFKKRQSDIRVQKSRVPHVSAPPRTKIRESEIRVPNKNIRVIRVIRVQKNTECDPCAKKYSCYPSYACSKVRSVLKDVLSLNAGT